jgi:hypothetical protein
VTLIDIGLLDLTERWCRRFQRLTGRTNVWLAVQLTNLSIVIYFVWAAAFLKVVRPWLRVAIALFCVTLFYGLTQTILRVPIETAEGNAYRRVAKGLRNPRRVRDAALRISFLTLSVLLPAPSVLVYVSLGLQIALLGYSLIVLTTAVLYLLACDPLPPCRGTVWAWIRRALPARTAEPAAGHLVWAGR